MFEIYDKSCSNLFSSEEIAQPTLNNPFAEILDNIQIRKYEFCIKATASDGLVEEFFGNFTYEIQKDFFDPLSCIAPKKQAFNSFIRLDKDP